MKLLSLAISTVLTISPALASPDELWDLLRLNELIEVMAEEGHAYGEGVAEEMFPAGGGPAWTAHVEALYDSSEMIAEIKPAFAAQLAEVDTGELLDFFGSNAGERIVASELAARRAFLDPEVETAAGEEALALARENPARWRLIDGFIDVNDLVESNVAASLTFTYAFSLGLIEGAGPQVGLGEGDAVAEAWAQEDALRSDTRDWLDAQLATAFAPLSEDDLRAYIAISQTEAGQALNAAYFRAFEPTLTRIAHGLGEGVARFIAGREI